MEKHKETLALPVSPDPVQIRNLPARKRAIVLEDLDSIHRCPKLASLYPCREEVASFCYSCPHFSA